MKRLVPALLLAASCAMPVADDQRVERVAAGVYAVRLDARIAADETVVPARAALIVGPDGVVVVDTGLSRADGARILEAAGRVTPKPVRLVILTHPAQEAIFGAAAFQERGIPVAMHADAAKLMGARCETCLGRLRSTLGADAMQGTRVVVPDRLLHDGEIVDEAGRALEIMAPPWSSAPGAIGVLDASTSTLVAGSMVSIASVPDLRDADVPRWKDALQRLSQTHCAHLVPAYGRIGACNDIAAFTRYLDELDARVGRLLERGVDLADVGPLADLPAYASWDRYDALHRANAAREYLRLEREALARP